MYEAKKSFEATEKVLPGVPPFASENSLVKSRLVNLHVADLLETFKKDSAAQ